MGDYLKENKVTDVFIAGLATDYCVKYTALDAAALGFNTTVVIDATRGVNLKEGDSERAIEEMKNFNIRMLQSSEVL